MGWSTIRNGELLASAAKEFDVFGTVDRNLSLQQNLPAFSIAVIVLRAKAIGFPTFGRLSQTCLRPFRPHRRVRSHSSGSNRAIQGKACRRGYASLGPADAAPHRGH
jgi:hypothetical protein